MKIVGQKNLKLLGGQAFSSQGPCDLDLWPSDLKINRGHLQIMTNLHAKYEDCVSKESYVIWRTRKNRRTARRPDGRPAGQTDVRTDKLIPVYPFTTLLCGGIKKRNNVAKWLLD
jgi:hypothetical protein